jgi:hypothetical protein
VLKQLKGGGKAKVEDEPKGKSKKDAGAAPENKSGKKSKKGKAE